VSLQAWSPLDSGWLCGRNPADPSAPPTAAATASLVAKMAARYGVAPEAIVLAWLMRHPAGIQPIIGTMNLERIRACCRAVDLEMDRADWYRLYLAARGKRLP
jgi:predicted oxidoreductase